MTTRLRSPVSVARYASIIVAIATMALGLHSHFQSDWTNLYTESEENGAQGKLHQLACDATKLEAEPMPCPAISMERYFVSIVILTFIISLIGLLASLVIDLESQPLKFVDLGYHAVAAVLLLIAGVVYVVSAAQIHNLKGIGQNRIFKLLESEKYAAGALTILQSVIYAGVAILIGMIKGGQLQLNWGNV